MSDEEFFYSKSGFAPYPDGSGFKVTVTIKQQIEESEPTISIDQIYDLSVSEWKQVSGKIDRLLTLVQRTPQESDQ